VTERLNAYVKGTGSGHLRSMTDILNYDPESYLGLEDF